MMQQYYQLIVIEPEKVPLASGPGTADSFPGMTLAVMMAVVVFICIWAYLARCRDYRDRIRKCDPGGEVYLGWNIMRLKRTAEELELDMAGAFNIS